MWGVDRAFLNTFEQELSGAFPQEGKDAPLDVGSLKWPIISDSKKGVLYTQTGRILWGKYHGGNVKYVVGKATLTHPRGTHVELPGTIWRFQIRGVIRQPWVIIVTVKT